MQTSPLLHDRKAGRGTARAGRPEVLASCHAGRTQHCCAVRRVRQACLYTAQMLLLGMVLWPLSVWAEEPLRIDINAGTSITDSSDVTLNGQKVDTAATLNAPAQSLVVQSTSNASGLSVEGLVNMVVHDMIALTNAPHAGTSVTLIGNATNPSSLTLVGDGSGQSLIRHQLLGTTSVQDIEKVIVGRSTLNLGLADHQGVQGGYLAQVRLQETSGRINVNGNGVDTSSYAVGVLEMPTNCGKIQVSDSRFSVEQLVAQSGTLHFKNSSATVQDVQNGTLDNRVTVGSGSLLNAGRNTGTADAPVHTAMDAQLLHKALTYMGAGPDKNNVLPAHRAALALAAPWELGSRSRGQIIVDDAVDQNASISGLDLTKQSFYLGEDSLLLVDAAGLGGADIPAIKGQQDATLEKNTRLMVFNAPDAGKVTLLSVGGTLLDKSDWAIRYGEAQNATNDNTMDLNPDRMQSSYLEVNTTGPSKTVILYTGSVTDAQMHRRFPGMDEALYPAMRSLWSGNGGHDLNAVDNGIRFLSRAANRWFVVDDREAALTIEGAARLAVTAGVPQMTVAAADAGSAAVAARLDPSAPQGSPVQVVSLDQESGIITDDGARATGLALWITPLYQHSYGMGLEAGTFSLDTEGSLGGVSVGADYLLGGSVRAGVSLSLGGGHSEASGDFSGASNDVHFWGFSLYGGWNHGNFGLKADAGCTFTFNELQQELPAGMDMPDITGDINARAISAGLSGQYRFDLGPVSLTPHAGVRLVSLHSDDYSMDCETTLLDGKNLNQTFWTFPVGCSLSADFQTESGWLWRPVLDMTLLPVAGEVYASTETRFSGTPTVVELETQTMDHMSYKAAAGLEVARGNWQLSLDYSMQVGTSTIAHGAFGTLRYEF